MIERYFIVRTDESLNWALLWLHAPEFFHLRCGQRSRLSAPIELSLIAPLTDCAFLGGGCFPERKLELSFVKMFHSKYLPFGQGY